MGMVNLDKELHKQLRHLATDMESSIGKLVNQSVERFLQEAAVTAKNGKKAAKK